MAFWGTGNTRKLAAIVFTDIVDYSALVHRDEALGERALERSRALVRRLVPRHGGREIETAGDSFLLEFPSALGAVRAVIAIQKELSRSNAASRDPPVALRASIPLGDVEYRGAKVFGDGVNIAARLLPLSPPGGLALSGSVRSLIRQRLEFPQRSIGTPPLKNISKPVEIFVVDADDLLALELPEARATPARRVLDRRLLALIGAALLLLGGLLLINTQRESQSPVRMQTTPVADGPSIAVLPLVNSAGDSEDEYFADGLTEELIGRLARIPSPIAELYAARREPDRAFEWLEKAYADSPANLTDMLTSAFLRDYRDDPRFITLCERIGLPR